MVDLQESQKIISSRKSKLKRYAKNNRFLIWIAAISFGLLTASCIPEKEVEHREEIISIVDDSIEEETEIIEEEPIEEVVEEESIYSSDLLDSGYEFLDIDFNSLIAQNSDCVGWIDIKFNDGSYLNYPVMMGDQYIHEDMDNNRSSAGLPLVQYSTSLLVEDESYLDIRNTLSKATVIQGHRMRNGTVFGKIDDMENIILYTPDGNVYKVDFFAKEVVDGTNYDGYHIQDYDSEDTFNYRVSELMQNASIGNNDLDIQFGSDIVIASACAYLNRDIAYEDLGDMDPDNLRKILIGVATPQYTSVEQMNLDNSNILRKR